jgi:ribonuclease HI
LADQPISHPDIEYFTDGSSFVLDSTHFTGYEIVTLDAVTEARPLLVRTSTQKAELIALTRVLQLAAGVQVNIYTNSKYAFITFMSMEPYIKKGGSLTQEEKVLSIDKKFWNC